ncbi:MAG: AmmeMemoRadiSam system protein B [candidate division KSB1 bacterium]|nr:AmmeMemoRadiSam system protein B [candidate division KSB1 bacterium]
MTLKRKSFHASPSQISKYPQLRHDLEPFHVYDRKGRLYYGLNDPLNLGDEQLLISSDLYYLLQFMDGEHSQDEIQAEYLSKFGNRIEAQRYFNLLKKLDSCLLMMNDRFRHTLRQAHTEYKKTDTRLPACSEHSYPEDPQELTQFMNELTRNAQSHLELATQLVNRTVKAAVAPHIDVRKGGKMYAQVYKLLALSKPADLYVILGTGHMTMQMPFALTRKHFQTPLAKVKTDWEMADHIARQCEFDAYADEFAHRNEHSIEFQTLFLSHFFEPTFKILPVLCSFQHQQDDETEKMLKSFTRTLNNVLSQFKGSICVIASVDLAHVGLAYGDTFKPDPRFLADVERSDKNT